VTIAYRGAPPNLEGLDDVQVIWRHEGRITLRVRGDVSLLLAALQQCTLEDVTIAEPSLEEVFLDYYREGPA